MKSLFTQRPRFYVALFVMSGLTGYAAPRAAAVTASPEYPNQCWYEVGTTPSCQYCFDPCGGSGYVCCRISVQPADNVQ